MARRRSAAADRIAVQRDDVGTLSVMAQITDRAGGNIPAGPAVDPKQAQPPTLPPPRVTESGLHEARVLLSKQNAVEGARLSGARRVVMRASRIFTFRLVGAGRALADAVEVLESTQGLAIAQLQQRIERLTTDRNAESARRDIDTQSLVATTSRLTLERDRTHNGLHAQLTSLDLAVEDVATAAARAAADLRESIAKDVTELRENATRVAVEMQHTARGLDTRLGAMERSTGYDRSELQRTRGLVNRLVRSVAALPATSTGELPATSSKDRTESDVGMVTAVLRAPALDDATYVDFEHRFRGSRDEIRARQQDAVPFVARLAGSNAPFLDLGCGRGEWLDLLGELKVQAYGVDSNSAMVDEAVRAGLDARLGDALEHLEQLESSSLQGISAFHFVEHIPLDTLVTLLDGCLIALRPGGTLLLETPNPTNLVVGAASFYLDPTHLRALHPDFLSFLVESRGFTDVEVHFVHPVIDAAVLLAGQPDDEEAGGDARIDRVVRGVEWALFGPQDYLISAKRPEVAL